MADEMTRSRGHRHIRPGGKSALPAFILGKATSRLNANMLSGSFSKPIQNSTHESKIPYSKGAVVLGLGRNRSYRCLANRPWIFLLKI